MFEPQSDPALASHNPKVIPHSHRTLLDMEMQSHSRNKKRGAIEEHDGEDRLSQLPDDVLHSILHGLPLKQAARTSALSRRWARTWLSALAYSRVLDFTDRDFARGQAPAAAATVSYCLRLHAEHGAALDVFRVALTSPPPGGAGALERDVVGWVESAVARGAREVDVDLKPPPAKGDADDRTAAFMELPGDLLVATNSLARLAFGGFSLRAVRAGAAGLAGLRSLSLSHADVTEEAVRDVVSSCRALEHLTLSSCNLLESIRIGSETLRVLEIVRCPAVRELRVTAPALESFAFHGDIFYVNGDHSEDKDLSASIDDDDEPAIDLGFTPALRDAYLSHIGFEEHVFGDIDDAYGNMLSSVEHAPVWTLCSVGLRLLSTAAFAFAKDVDTTNIQELQLLMATSFVNAQHLLCGTDDPFIRQKEEYYDEKEDFESLLQFFWRGDFFPLLDRLFVRFPAHATEVSDAAAALPGEVVDDSKLWINFGDFVFDSLSFIKVVNFRGTRLVLQLLAFLLKRAPALEQLVLVTVEEAPVDEHVVQGWVSVMQKASSVAQLTVCRSSQDRSQNPVHTRFYHEE